MLKSRIKLRKTKKNSFPSQNKAITENLCNIPIKNIKILDIFKTTAKSFAKSLFLLILMYKIIIVSNILTENILDATEEKSIETLQTSSTLFEEERLNRSFQQNTDNNNWLISERGKIVCVVLGIITLAGIIYLYTTSNNTDLPPYNPSPSKLLPPSPSALLSQPLQHVSDIYNTTSIKTLTYYDPYLGTNWVVDTMNDNIRRISLSSPTNNELINAGRYVSSLIKGNTRENLDIFDLRSLRVLDPSLIQPPLKNATKSVVQQIMKKPLFFG